MPKKETVVETRLDIEPIRMERASTWLVGITPMIMHRYALKAWQELLLPSKKKNAAARSESLKHDPLTEFRECCYRNRDAKEPTLLHYPSGAFTKAIAAAALDLPGASKSQILRLVSITSMQVNVYGMPTLGLDMIRNSDMKRTPDVRTRAYLPEWCCLIDVEYVKTLVGQAEVFNLVGAAGLIVGLGDYRPQKGGSYGKFAMAPADDPRVLRICKQGRAVQEAALASPTFFNDDSAELYEWFTAEVERREKVLPSAKADGKPVKQPKTVAKANANRKTRTDNGRATAQ